jgi:formate/nitrite transporter FocA (FNT family)
MYSEGPIGILEICLLIAGAVLAYWPLMLLANLAGAALVVLVMVWTRMKSARQVGSAGAT